MSRINFCLISPWEAIQLQQGENISCRDHRHIARAEVLQLTGGYKLRPWLDTQECNFQPIADWAMMPDGSESQRHVVLRQAKEWRAIKSGMQLVPIGGKGRTTGNRYKLHCKPPRAPKCKVLHTSISKL